MMHKEIIGTGSHSPHPTLTHVHNHLYELPNDIMTKIVLFAIGSEYIPWKQYVQLLGDSIPNTISEDTLSDFPLWTHLKQPVDRHRYDDARR